MSAQATVIAFDGAATPVVHNLLAMGTSRTPEGVLLADWSERIANVPFSAQVSISTRKRTIKNGQDQVSLSSRVPVMEAILNQNASGYTAAPAIAFEDVFVTTGYFSPRSTEASRKLAMQLHLNVLGGVTTTVTPVVTGPSAELFQKNVAAS